MFDLTRARARVRERKFIVARFRDSLRQWKHPTWRGKRNVFILCRQIYWLQVYIVILFQSWIRVCVFKFAVWKCRCFQKRRRAEDRVVFMRSTLRARWQITRLMLQPEGKTSHFMKLPISLSVVCRPEFSRWLIVIIMHFASSVFVISRFFFLRFFFNCSVYLRGRERVRYFDWIRIERGNIMAVMPKNISWRGNKYRNQMTTALACYNYTKAFGFPGRSSPLLRQNIYIPGLLPRRQRENVERMPEAYGEENTRGK